MEGFFHKIRYLFLGVFYGIALKMPSYALYRIIPIAVFKAYSVLRKNDANLILDAGCGTGNVIKRFQEIDQMYNNLGRKFIVGFDVDFSQLKISKNAGLYDAAILADARYLPFRAKSFDLVLAMEIIEHLNKSDGKEFIRNLEEIARKQIIISTPLGFFKTPYYKNEWQRHKSGWLPTEFSRMGYKVRYFLYLNIFSLKLGMLCYKDFYS